MGTSVRVCQREKGWPRLLYAVWLLYGKSCCMLYHTAAQTGCACSCMAAIQQHTAAFLLYCCMVCCMERLDVWRVWCACGPHPGRLTHSMLVLYACMRPETRFRHTRTPITPMAGAVWPPYITIHQLMYGRHTSAYSSFFAVCCMEKLLYCCISARTS